MAFIANYVTDGDMAKVVDVMFDTFGDVLPAINAIYPNHETAKGRVETVERLKSRNQQDRMVHHLKMQEVASGHIVGQGTWFIKEKGMKSGEHGLEGPWWNSEEERQWANDLVMAYFKRRWRTFRDIDGPVFAISSMCVLPEYQRSGAGAAFMNWGLERADRCGAECVVESAPGANGFYAKYGFVSVEEVNLGAEMPTKWKGRPEQHYTWMRRPARGLL